VDALLSAHGITKRFGGIRALDGIDFTVGEGDVLGIIGPNGAGKTALINTITGFYRADSGSIRFAGAEISRLPIHSISRRGIARTFQNIRIFKRLTVLENVLVAGKWAALQPLAALFRLRKKKPALETARSLLSAFGLEAKADWRAASLSYGEARRLEIARALYGAPQVLLLDEPAAGMNEAETERLVNDIRKAQHRLRAVVLIEHDMSLIRALSTRLIAMDYGRKIAEGEPAAVLAHPQVRRAYLGEET
jgi:branched-chain amino acid transport system ATP-binding protein